MGTYSPTKAVTIDIAEDQVVLLREVIREDTLSVSPASSFVDYEPFPVYIDIAELILIVPLGAGRIRLHLEILAGPAPLTINNPSIRPSGGIITRFESADIDGTNRVFISDNVGLEAAGGSISTQAITLDVDASTEEVARRYIVSYWSSQMDGNDIDEIVFTDIEFSARAELR
jgi:hypothetical protein